MSGKMVPITAYTNSVEAGMIKSRLESAGIPVFLEGEESGNILGIVNLQGIRVLIDEDDLAHAEQILNQFETEEADDYREPRRKKRRKPRESSDAIRSPNESPLQAPSPVRTEPPADAPPIEEPEAKAEVEHEHEKLDEDRPHEHEEAERKSRSFVLTPDDFARYAFRSAVLGLVGLGIQFFVLFGIVCIIGTFYSLYMLIRMATLPGDLSRRGRIMGFAALTLNLFMCLFLSQYIRHRLWPD
jgi:Putative prokaryotic signal transducing protein